MTAILLVEVTSDTLEQHLAASPAVVGKQLAERVDRHVKSRGLNYYPALDFFRDHSEAVEPDLLDAADNIGWFACAYVREELQRRLRAAFSSVHIVSMRSQAFVLPPVRPHQRDARARLARHYAPNSVKVELRLALLRKHAPDPETVEKTGRHLLWRWLKHRFASMEVASVRAAS